MDLGTCATQRADGYPTGQSISEAARSVSQNRRSIMTKERKQLDELFHDTLKDIYFAEKKILATLPKMAKAAQSTDLKKAFEKHRGETEGHVTRLENAIVGITDEGAEIMKEYKGSPALDAGLLAAAQASNTMRCRVTAPSRLGRRNLA
jgi:hypothetical protein